MALLVSPSWPQPSQTQPAEQPLRLHNGQLNFAFSPLRQLPKAVESISEEIVVLDLTGTSINAKSLRPTLARMRNLRELVLDRCGLNSSLELPSLPHLTGLSLARNEIQSLEPLLTMLRSSCPQLRYLNLLCNPACPSQIDGYDVVAYRQYRSRVLQALPKLTQLDASSVQADEKFGTKPWSFLSMFQTSSPTNSSKRRLAPPHPTAVTTKSEPESMAVSPVTSPLRFPPPQVSFDPLPSESDFTDDFSAALSGTDSGAGYLDNQASSSTDLEESGLVGIIGAEDFDSLIQATVVTDVSYGSRRFQHIERTASNIAASSPPLLPAQRLREREERLLEETFASVSGKSEQYSMVAQTDAVPKTTSGGNGATAAEIEMVSAPMNLRAFTCFLASQADELERQGFHSTVMQAVCVKWRIMSAADRETYEKQVKEMQAEYNMALANLRCCSHDPLSAYLHFGLCIRFALERSARTTRYVKTADRLNDKSSAFSVASSSASSVLGNRMYNLWISLPQEEHEAFVSLEKEERRRKMIKVETATTCSEVWSRENRADDGSVASVS